jgi:hypothetical protein
VTTSEIDFISFDSQPSTQLLSSHQRQPRLMIVGIGVDLLHLSRLRGLLARRQPHQLASRILSQTELLEWERHRASAASTGQESYLALR